MPTANHLVALVGSESLLGSELNEQLGARVDGISIRAVGSEDAGSAILTERGGEPVVITGIDQSTLAEAEAVVLAGTFVSARRSFEMAPSTLPVIDTTGALEDVPEARIRAPLAESGPSSQLSRVQVVAHPAATMLATVLRRLQKRSPIVRAVATILEPVSERGRLGVDELQQQTTQLLSFQPLSKVIFGEQLAFNLLAEYGEDAPLALGSIEQRIEKHLASLLAHDPPVPMPSLRLVQAPVMHGYSISLWVELNANLSAPAVEAALSGDPLDIRSRNLPAGHIVGLAGEDGITAGPVTGDRNHPRSFWIWLAADNFRVTAANAAALLEEILA